MILEILVLILLALLIVLWAVYLAYGESQSRNVTLVVFANEGNLSLLREWLPYHTMIDNVKEIRMYVLGNSDNNSWAQKLLVKKISNHAGISVTTVSSVREAREDCRNRSHSPWILELNCNEYLVIQRPLAELLDSIPKTTKCLLPVFSISGEFGRPVMLQRKSCYSRPHDVERENITAHQGIGIESKYYAMSPQNLDMMIQNYKHSKPPEDMQILQQLLQVPSLILCYVESDKIVLEDVKSCCALYDKVYLYCTGDRAEEVLQECQNFSNVYVIGVTEVYNMQQIYIFHILQCLESKNDEPQIVERNMFARAHEIREVTEKYFRTLDHQEGFWCLNHMPENFCVRREVLLSYNPDAYKEIRDTSKDKKIIWKSLFGV
jgi:hypothetical protein